MTSILVRPVANLDEQTLQLQLADQAFAAEPSAESTARWQQLITSSPEYRPEEIRGAFRDNQQMGGYIIYERKLRMGAAQLTTGCISAVVTHPAYRHQEVARTMMQDAIHYALAHRHALLLLDGIPKFYYRFGYTDMFDISTQDINRRAILAHPPSTYSVRPATIDDTAAVLALYKRHYSPYTGSFTRTHERQAHMLQHRSQQNPLLLASDPSGKTRAYLTLSRGEEYPKGLEMAADNWEATLALLQHHANLLSGPDAPMSLYYRLPPDAPILHWMIDNLEVPDTTMWRHPADEWGVRSQTFHHRYTGWMARLAHIPTLAQEILPEWQARWQRSLARWSGTFSLLIDEEICTLHIDGSELTLVEGRGPSTLPIHFTMQEFVQILFGYRPISQILERREQAISSELRSVLNILFPAGHTWIPSSDGF